MKPLVSYHGGKQKLARRLLELFPPHSVYVEPFAGGATCLFAKPLPPVTNSHHYREVINDRDGRLITLYRVAKTRPDELIPMIEATLYSEAGFNRAKDITRGVVASDELTMAWAVWVELQSSFGNCWNSAWGRGISGQNHSRTYATKVDRLREQCDRLRGVYIACGDALDVIRQWDAPQTLHYCDPPYPGTKQVYRGEAYATDDFQQLLDLAANSAGSFVISSYECDVEIPPDFVRHEFASRITHHANSKRRTTRDRETETTEETRRTECVWVLDRSGRERESIRPIVERNGQMWVEKLSEVIA